MTRKDRHSSKKLISDKSSPKKRALYVIGMGAIIIFLLTLIVYTPALKNDFVWDDYQYVYENNAIRSLNPQSLYWMLTSFHAANWHPLTWLSHSIDYALWGLKPRGHRFTNLVLHGFNTVMVFFLVIMLMLRAKESNGILSLSKIPLSILIQVSIASGVTALLFGIHPSHVESVAWVAERKDLLCGLFALLTLLSYLSYTSSIVKRYRWIWFNTSLFLFLLALMSKPMAVTLPFILLLLDLYPLKRLEPYLHKNSSLLLEKMPFFVLSIASSAITIIAQHTGGAVKSFEHMPISFRLVNGLHSLVFYLEKMIWPHKLVPFYPLPKYIYPFDLQYIISGILVLAITGGCFWMMKKGKYLFFIAWSYYLITLLPVLGIIQVGSQAAADRYTYLPSISLFLLVGVAVLQGWEKFSLTRFKIELRGLLLVFVCTVVFLLSYLTISQIKIWQDSEIFWSYIISVFPKNSSVTYDNLGVFYAKEGRLDEAISKYKQALAINPNYAGAHSNLGVVYAKKGRLDEAISECKKAIAINPNLIKAHTNLGNVYVRKGMLDEAIAEYKKTLSIKPNLAEAHYGLGNAYAKKGMLDEAISEYKKALTIKPNLAEAHYSLGNVYAQKGRLDEAISEYKKALTIKPNLAEAHYSLGNVYAKKGRFDEAISQYKKTLAIKPNFTEAYYKVGSLLKIQGKLREAISTYREAIRLKPDCTPAYNDLAWIYATSPDAAIRNGGEAVILATKACELTGFKKAEVVDTLAAAYAEQGDFKKAVEYQSRAIELALPQIKRELQKRLQLYKLEQPYWDQ